MFELILATAALAASTTETQKDPMIEQLSKDFYSLEIGEFRKPIPFRNRHERSAERAVKKANCDMYAEVGWVHARVDFAMKVSSDGRITKIIPVDTGCRALEKYVINHLQEYAGGNDVVLRPGSGKWYRQSMTFRWPE